MNTQKATKNTAHTNTSKKDRSFVFILCIFYVAATLFIALSGLIPSDKYVLNVISLGVCAFSVFALACAARSYKSVLGYVFILAILVFLGDSIYPVSLFAAFITAASLFAHMLLRSYSHFIWGLPLVTLITSLLVRTTPTCAIYALCTLPAALMLAYSVKKRLQRVSAVCYISFGICLSLAALFISSLFAANGKISVQIARDTIDTFRVFIIDTLDTALSDLEIFGELGISSTDLSSYLEYAVNTAFNLLPAIIITLSNVTAYMLHSIFLGVYAVTDEEKKDALPMFEFDMSVVSAIVFLICGVLSIIPLNDSATIYGVAALNIFVILCPGLVFTALGAVRALTHKRGPSCLGTILYTALLFSIFSFNVFAIIGSAVAGAAMIIFVSVTNKKSK